MNATDWITAISSALMVIITYVYVKATIHISKSNKESAEASRKQIEESQKQQKQNVGLQLYAMRKEIIHKITDKQYNEVFWDVPLLFNDELSSEFQNVASKAQKIEKLQTAIDLFENGIGSSINKTTSEHIRTLREQLRVHDDVTLFRESIAKIINDISNTKTPYSIDEYVDFVTEAKKLGNLLSIENVQLVLKLNDFIRNSIQ